MVLRGNVTTIEQIALRFSQDIHAPLRMNSHDFNDSLTFHLLSPSGQIFFLSNTLVYDQIPAKLMTFPSASAGLGTC